MKNNYIWAKVTGLRSTPISIHQDYRPHLYLENQELLGVSFLDGESDSGKKTIIRGEGARVKLGLLYSSNKELRYELLKKGSIFVLKEGDNIVATGIVEEWVIKTIVVLRS